MGKLSDRVQEQMKLVHPNEDHDGKIHSRENAKGILGINDLKKWTKKSVMDELCTNAHQMGTIGML